MKLEFDTKRAARARNSSRQSAARLRGEKKVCIRLRTQAPKSWPRTALHTLLRVARVGHQLQANSRESPARAPSRANQTKQAQERTKTAPTLSGPPSGETSAPGPVSVSHPAGPSGPAGGATTIRRRASFGRLPPAKTRSRRPASRPASGKSAESNRPYRDSSLVALIGDSPATHFTLSPLGLAFKLDRLLPSLVLTCRLNWNTADGTLVVGGHGQRKAQATRLMPHATSSSSRLALVCSQSSGGTPSKTRLELHKCPGQRTVQARVECQRLSRDEHQQGANDA